MRTLTVPNPRRVDLVSYRGGLESASYCLRPDDPGYDALMSEVEDLFRRHATSGMVEFPLETHVYLGRLR